MTLSQKKMGELRGRQEKERDEMGKRMSRRERVKAQTHKHTQTSQEC